MSDLIGGFYTATTEQEEFAVIHKLANPSGHDQYIGVFTHLLCCSKCGIIEHVPKDFQGPNAALTELVRRGHDVRQL